MGYREQKKKYVVGSVESLRQAEACSHAIQGRVIGGRRRRIEGFFLMDCLLFLHHETSMCHFFGICTGADGDFLIGVLPSVGKADNAVEGRDIGPTKHQAS